MSHTIIRKYGAWLESHGGLDAALRRYGLIHLVDAAIREAWISCGVRILRLLGRSPANGYGWLEALLFPTCDYWTRYARVVEALKGIGHDETLRLLEVSSGRGGIAWLMRDSRIRTCLVDRDPEAVSDARGGNSWRVCADAASLPFAADSFEVVISVDTIEHLPGRDREAFVNELKRVAARVVILTCPMQSEDGEFRAAEFDRKLKQVIKTRNGYVPAWLEEHLQEGHPTREHLLDLLPEARIIGSQNCDAWFRYASAYIRSFGWLIAGLRSRTAFRQRDAVPPHWRGTAVWKKRDLRSQATSDPAIAFESETQPSFVRT